MLESRVTLEIRILSSVLLKVSTQAVEQRLNEKGLMLSLLQFGILRLLSHENFTLSELSRKMLLDPSTLVPSINSLEKKGYIERHRDLDDRRRFPLYLTDAAQQLLEEIPVVSEDDPLHIALGRLAPGDPDILRDLLRQAVANLPDGETMLEEMHLRLKNASG